MGNKKNYFKKNKATFYMENRHQLKSLNFFLSGLDGHSRHHHPTPHLDCIWTWLFYADCHVTKAYPCNFQHASKLKHRQPYFSWLGVITSENKGSEGRQFLLEHYFDTFVCSRFAERPFPGLISIHKYVTELKVSTLQNEVVWMSGEMGLQKIHSNFVSRQFTFGPVMIWVFLLMAEI